MRYRMKLPVALLVLAVACAPAAARVSLQPGAAVEPEQRLALWQGVQVDTLHGVQVSDSTLSGVPVWQPASCDSCRVVLPLGAIDSVLELPHGRSTLVPAAAAVVGAAAMAGIWAWSD
ncbi:MAG TPA: hypothetical protein VFL88_08855 [Gemmatimonadales bacterium]|nr:hypothetical protein [Gemmatimonadales bacterium]